MTRSLIAEYESLIDALYEKASDEKTDKKTLEELSKLTDMYILTGVYCNPNTSNKVLLEALRNYCGVGGPDEETRIHIVYNPGLNEDVLKRIVDKDPSEEVREAALTSFALRIANRLHVKHEEISELQEMIKERIKDDKRRKMALEAIEHHLNR